MASPPLGGWCGLRAAGWLRQAEHSRLHSSCAAAHLCRLLAAGFLVMIAANTVFALDQFASMQGEGGDARGWGGGGQRLCAAALCGTSWAAELACRLFLRLPLFISARV